MSRDGWIQTFTGRQFWPLNPHPNHVDILDIAHALSLKCRFGGHCSRFYSVAEHSVHVANHVPREVQLAALLHDASEAYLADVPRPLKDDLVGYRLIENEVEQVIAQAFDVEWPWPDEVKIVDTRILNDEKAQLLGPQPAPWRCEWIAPSLEIELPCWSPTTAEEKFLEMFDRVSV